MISGWIKLHRKLLEWEHYSKPVTRSLFIHLLLVNDSGIVTATRKSLAKELGFTEQEVRTALKNLSESGEVQIISNPSGSKIFVKKWEDYQFRKSTNQLTNQITNLSTNQNLQENRINRAFLEDLENQSTNLSTNQITNQSTNDGKEEKKEAKKRRKDIQEEKEKIYIKKKKFGSYQNVLLTEQEYETLQNDYKNSVPSVDEMINRLDEYIGQFGNKYKSHYITIKAWYRREQAKPKINADIGMPTYKSEKHEKVDLNALYERIKKNDE